MDQLKNLKIEPEKFLMTALPFYAAFLLENHLDAYVNKVIDCSRREELPLLKKLDRFTTDELHALGKISHGEILEALATNTVHLQIEENVKKWVANNLEVIDKNEVVAEDVTLSAFIKRRCLQSFIPSYTSDVELQERLREEIDRYTTQEELISYDTYLRLQQDNLNIVNDALKFQESLLLEAQELSDLGSFYVDYQNPVKSMSTPQIEKITGLSDAQDSEFFNYVHPDDRERIKKEWEHAMTFAGAFDYSFRYSVNGITKRLHSRGVVTHGNGVVKYVKGTLRDITTTAQLIERLSESETLNKEAQKLTHLGNWSWDIETNSIIWSDEMYRIYGLEPQSEEITFERFIDLIHPDNRESRIKEINESLETGIVNDYTLKIMTPAGEIKILRGLGSLAKNADNKPIKLVGTCQDITEEYRLKNELIEVNRELSEKNTELIRSNKELESFNYIASHDLQEPLRKIQLYSEKIQQHRNTLPADVMNTLEKVINAATRMRTLINDLMAFSQISLAQPMFEMIPLDSLFEEASENFSEMLEQGQVVFNIDPLPEEWVIPFQFQQLIINIFGNAIKYRKPDQAVNINVTSEFVNGQLLDVQNAKGNYLKIEISDNGIGFSSDQNEYIFDLFRRLHSNDTYSGTGIGLAICKKIMQNHGGYITAEGIPNIGSTFTILIPHHNKETNVL